MPDLITRILTFINKNNLIKPHQKILVGLSGGADSVFLLHILKQLETSLNISLIAAHLDHEWRENSHDDLIFCQQLCQKLAVPFFSAKSSDITIAKKYNGSAEELARITRLIFFNQIAQLHQADRIALAHHADDQQETFFIRLMRGATLSGLAAIRAQQSNYIRPLLEIYKHEIVAYLNQHAISYCSDITNSSPAFLRNRIRANVLPVLKDTDIRFNKNFAKAISSIAQTESFLEKLTKQVFDSLLVSGTTICLETFFEQDYFLQKRLIIYWLCHAKVPFTPSTGLLAEILLFLKKNKLKKNSHIFYADWSIHTIKNRATIKKAY